MVGERGEKRSDGTPIYGYLSATRAAPEPADLKPPCFSRYYTSFGTW